MNPSSRRQLRAKVHAFAHLTIDRLAFTCGVPSSRFMCAREKRRKVTNARACAYWIVRVTTDEAPWIHIANAFDRDISSVRAGALRFASGLRRGDRRAWELLDKATRPAVRMRECG